MYIRYIHGSVKESAGRSDAINLLFTDHVDKESKRKNLYGDAMFGIGSDLFSKFDDMDSSQKEAFLGSPSQPPREGAIPDDAELIVKGLKNTLFTTIPLVVFGAVGILLVIIFCMVCRCKKKANYQYTQAMGNISKMSNNEDQNKKSQKPVKNTVREERKTFNDELNS